MRALLLPLVVLLVGCFASSQTMRAKREDSSAGIGRAYDEKCAALMKRTKQAATDLQLEMLDEDRANGEILLRRGSKGLAGEQGDRIAVWFDRADGGKSCTVRVYARGQNVAGYGGDEWPERIHRALSKPND